ncbi:hypothetical protein [Ruminococcus flavefaciens]|uniref:Ig-like domain-containing protein n=1 Tax=Ruminococcus flavefaciens 007c TaxID=1341157 RepID=W7UIJ7_RUMFL|nr:hypothetical protein [Ruminococcus flavefaciens]EWM55086.1 hypothetical protein RF007C_05285 [Ruminococcus flavefaciens 007c]
MFKKFLSTILSAVTAASFIPQIPANAEETAPYPYTLFAGSDEEGAITINSNNICINGSIATNGTISTTAQNFNVNGERKENLQEEKKLFFNKINDRYFNSHVDTYFEDYFLEDTNININIPIEAEGNIGLTGNINITSGIKALNDVSLSGNVENSQDSVICAETGDIIINTDNVNLNGLVYAPYGCVNITAQNLNINSVIIIADTITITCPNLNANYNAQMAEFLGNESEAINNDDIEIVAYGEYDEEAEIFSVYWNTTVPDGSFDIQASDDGESYTSIGTVTNADSFECTFTESFEKKYIKVIETTNNGTICESVPFVVISTENGYDTEVLDSDEDGLPDIYELKIGTDLYDQDTDDDGLTDYQEYVYTQTDPLVYDSVTEGISDADIDTDEDGLSNIDEFTRGTYPWTFDTDLDGLSDYDEIYVYGTDPLIADSDDDGIDDGSEIKLGFDPNDLVTNGVPDGEYAVQQSISADNSILSSINTAESPYVLSIDIKTNGDAEEELTVDESGYSAAIENDAMIGASVNIDITDTCNPEEIVLQYDIKEAYIDNTLDKFSSLGEFQGIKRLNVFRFDEEERMLLPVETEFDVENNKLYAAVNETGTYCLMDMEIWLDNLDVEMPAANNVPAPKPAPNSLNKQINLVFMLQANYNQLSNETEEEYSQRFEFQKNIIRKMSRVVFSKLKGVDVKIYIIAYDNLERDCCVTAPNNNKYFSDYKSISDALDEVNYKKNTSPANREIAFMCAEENTPVNTNSNTFIYNLINGESEYNTIHDIPSNTYINGYHIPAGSYADGYYLERITAYGNIYSQLYYDLNDFPESVLSAAIIHPSRGGLSIPFDMTSDDNFGYIKNHFFTNAQQRLGMVISDKLDIIVPTKWKKITLISDLTPNGATNSDKDSLTDWEEVDTSKITINSYGMVELPVFRLADIIGHLTRFNTNGEYNFLLNDPTPRYYLPIHSDPTDEDTDDDGLNDDVDREPLKYFLYELLNKLELMEKYIDDYFEFQYGKDLTLRNLNLIQVADVPRSTISINIIRNLYYGSEKRIGEELSLIDHFENYKQTVKWLTTDGTAFPFITRYINKKDPSIINYFKKYRKERLVDNQGNGIDLLHLLATLGAERHDGIIDANLAGWAGDLQSFIFNFKLETYPKEYDYNNQTQSEKYTEIAYQMLNGDIIVPKCKFTDEDLLADVDAENISEIYNENSSLSSVLKDYYTNRYVSRFDYFINLYNGKEEFDKLVGKYTKGNNPITHLILHNFASEAAKDQSIKDRYEASYITSIQGIPVYSLPNPAEVTDAESIALRDGFCKWIDLKLNEERNVS